MNKAILIGRLTRDPELRSTPAGRNVCQFSIAVNRTFTNANGDREADFINCVVWDKQAENLVKYQKKGNQIAVDGRIQTRNYEDKDGKRVYVTEILANNISFLDSKGSSAGNSNSFNNFNNLPEPPIERNNNVASMPDIETVSVEKDPFEAFGDSIEISDNDLPF
ncbi:MAG: single-stranded DNA-binding protein [Bacilli bacterium]|nr:MAG: single-stranded DNA-binding protein [Bacilli bacterium]